MILWNFILDGTQFVQIVYEAHIGIVNVDVNVFAYPKVKKGLVKDN